MNNAKNNRYSTIRVVITYLVIAGLYIFISDYILFEILSDDSQQLRYQIIKGLIFVLITAIVLYYLISKHDQIQRKLIQQNIVYDELITKLFDRFPAMILVYHPDLEKFRVNREFEEKTGWSNKDSEKVDLTEAVFPDPEVHKEVVEFMEKPGSGWKEFTMKTKQGKTIPARWTNIQLSDDTQVGIGIDLTEIKQREAEIRQSQILLQKTFDSLKESVILLDPKTRTILECNHSTEEIFGYSRDEMVGKSTQLLHIDEEHFQKFHKKTVDVLETSGSVQTEFKMKRKNGEDFNTGHTVTFVYDENNNKERVVSVIRDITEQKEYEKKLEQSLREKEILLQEVHHRVKNNLALVVGFLWFQQINASGKKLQEIFEKNIVRVRSIALIHEILYESDSLADIQIKIYFQKLIDVIGETFGPANVPIEFTCENMILNANQALPAALVVNELITNALKHAYPKEMSGSINLTIEEKGKKVYFKVSDTGRGLPESFDKKDYGLGFDIVSTLMTQLEAELEINSNGGTHISFSFEKKNVRGAASLLI